MICFLTGRIDAVNGELNPANAFVDELRRRFPPACRAVYVCSDPEGWALTEHYAALTQGYFEDAGFRFDRFCILDSRNERQAEALIRGSNLIVLSGGHVPTQNRFFQRIGLRELLRCYAGLVIGISAGSMNSADLVYAQPEEAGEAIDPGYRRFLPGLDLTKTMLLPHYQEQKDSTLDGLRLYEDVALPDSIGKTFYAIPDGSYLLIDGSREELRGEAYRIRDGQMTRIASDGETVSLCASPFAALAPPSEKP